MELCNILSGVWKNTKGFHLIEEELLLENTFMQQTSKGEHLWKAQLGMTKNYIIFLRCDTNLNLSKCKHSVTPEQVNVLINMVPMSHLKVKKHSKRKLEVLFPSGSVCYFKLLIRLGCGKAWSRWRALEQMCDEDILPLVPQSSMIPFSVLNNKIQKTLTEEKFLECFTDLKKYLADITESGEEESDVVNNKGRSPRFSTNSELNSDIDVPEVESIPKSENKQDEKTSVKDSERTDAKEFEKTPANKKDKKSRKRRHVRRFGEGIPEGCGFDLTLSYSDELTINKDTNRETVENNASLFDCIPLDERVSMTLSKSITDSEEQKSEKTMFVERNKKTNSVKMERILKSAQFFTNVSLLIIPDGLRKSKSVDSVNEISLTNYDKIYISTNASLPNINELMFHRRHNRLTYSTDHFDDTWSACLPENHSTHPVSFWLPDKKSDGRIYCTFPICRKACALKEKGCITRQKHTFNDITKTTRDNHHFTDLLPAKKSQLIKEVEERNHCLFINGGKKTFVKVSKANKTEGKYCITSESSPIDVEELAKEIKSVKGKQVSKSNIRRRKEMTFSKTLKPHVVAYELQLIQQRMFCEIESSELARFILKPLTVTEVNCPYLCGFLFFFERLKTLILAELHAQKQVEDAAQIYRLFVQVALACFKWGDEQSAYAIVGGLCDPIIFKYRKLWNYMLKQKVNEKYLFHLFKMFQKRRKLPITKQKLPFFLNFITFTVTNLMKESQKFPLLVKEKGSLQEIFTTISSSPERKPDTQRKKVFSELRVLSHGNYESLFTIIEECRKYFILENYLTKDIATKEYLLYKQFKMYTVK